MLINIDIMKNINNYTTTTTRATTSPFPSPRLPMRHGFLCLTLRLIPQICHRRSSLLHIYEKRCDFNFEIINSSHLGSNKSTSPAYEIYIFLLFMVF